ncbi:phage tail tip fiber protein [Pseudomonas gregormendelii]
MSAGVKKLAQVVVGAVVGFAQGGPWGAAIGAGLAFYAAEQQEKLNTKSPLRDNEPSAQTVRSSKAPVRFILGRVATGGVLVWAQEQSGNQADGEWLHMVYVLSEGAIDSLENIYLGEEEIGSFGAFASYELIVNPTQVNAFLKTNCPGWKDSQIGRGLSFVRVSLRYSAEKFPSGIPDARFVVKGRNDIFDPRTGATGYSANTALHILWYLRARCGVPDDEIVFSTFASAANVCDETVTNADGSVSQRYRTACVIGADEQRTGVLQKLEAACAGKLIRVGGRWMLQAGAYYGPHDFELTEDMVVGTITGSTEPANDAAINVVRGTFVDPSQSWTETDYPEVRVDQWVIEDGGEAAETLTFSYVTDPYQCQRLANIELRRRRAGGTINIPMNLSGYNCRPGRVIRVNLPSLNILGEFIVTNWSMGDKEGCSVSVAQYEQPIFSDAVGKPYNPIGFINLPAGGLGSPTNLKWAPVGSAEVTQGVLSWLPPTGIVKEYVVIVRQGGIAIQSHNVPATSTSCTINGLASGNYTMSVAAVGPMARSGETTLSVNVNGPPIPEACVVQSSIDSITLIPSNTLRGLNGGTYEYFFSTVPQSDPKDAVYVGQGLSFTHTGLGFFTNYYYFVRSSNAYGKSAFLYVPASTSNDVGAYLDALDGKLTESQLGQELLDRIELIDGPPALPGSVNNRLEVLDGQISEVTDYLQERVNDGQQALAEAQATFTEAQETLTEAQATMQLQLNQVSTIAKSGEYQKDKAYGVGASTRLNDRLYQAKIAVPADATGAKSPPNATYWVDVGQVVTDSNGLATRVSTAESKITNIEGVNTSQGTAITGLNNSLTTTNTNVTAAQTAANAANTLAGGKGKVIVQAAAPAVADQLAQNLWIDITGGANTPKRWTGSAWAAVTDKVATDAAAAAANALSVANTKADAAALTSLTTRVESTEGTISSQGSAITGLNNSLTTTNGNVTSAQNAANAANTLAGGKGKVIVQTAAPAVADQLAQNLWIDITGIANTPKRWNGSAWVAVTDKVATDAATAAANALSVANTKADAAALTSLTTRVTSAEGTISSQGTSITGLNNSLTTTNGNVTAAQNAANAANTLAGGKGKVIVQTGAPAVADQQVQNLWIDITGGANTPKRWTGSAWAAVTDKVATDAATAAANALSLANTKADAAALTSLTTRVESTEGTISSQGTSITGLNNSLTTTNGNVTAAQNAANAANTLAGGKGKVIVQTGAPAAADQQVQNLWIDITGGANTPKRWTGSAWAVVTDKVATDAAAAAANALSVANTKADAAALTSLTTRVTSAEGTISSQGTSITGLNNSLTTTNGNVTAAQNAANAANTLAGGKGKVIVQTGAPAAADQQMQNLWIDITGGANTPKRWTGGAWAPVTDKVATDAAAAAANALSVANTKADAAALTALNSRVSSTEGAITSQSDSLTQLNNSLTRFGDNSPTSVYQSLFNGLAVDTWAKTQAAAAATDSLSNVEGNISGATLTIDIPANANWWGVTNKKVRFDPTRLYKLAVRVQQVSVRAGTPPQFYAGLDCFADDGVTRVNTNGANSPSSSHYLLANAKTLVVGEWTELVTYVKGHTTGAGGSGQGTIASPKPLKAGSRYISPMLIAGYNNMGGVVALDYFTIDDVTDQVQIDATSAALASLDSTVTQQGTTLTSQGNSLTSLNNSLTATNTNVTAAQTAANAANTLAGGKGKVIVQTGAPAVADQQVQNLWIDITGGANTPKRWTGSAWAAVTDKVATDAATAAANALSVANTKADAAALTSLTSRVTSAEGTISSQGTSITGLNNSLTTTNTNVTAAQTAANAANTLAGGKGKVIVQTGAPAVADQQVQNLWIDITGGANTPKRWTGSAWAAVTDKVATDAATAAANALSVANTKADAAAVTALNSRVTSTEGAITSQSDSLTQLNNSLSSMQGDLAGLGLDPAPNALWQFDAGVEGWTNGGSTVAWADGQVTISSTGTDPTFSSPSGLGISGSLYTKVRARITRIAGAGWDGKVFYATPSHSVSSSFYKSLPNPLLAIGQSTVLEWDMAALSVGGSDWVNSTITQIRLDIGGASAADVFAVDWVVVGRAGPGASSAALSSLDSTVTQQGATLISQGTSLTSLSNTLTTTNTNVTAAQTAANAANTLAGGKGKVIVQTAAPAVADQQVQNLWIDITGGANTPKRWTGSAWAAVTDKVAADAAAAAASALSVANTKADASAVSSLTTRVTSTEQQITAQANKLDGIYVQVNPMLAGDTDGYAGSTGSFVGVWSEQSARIEDGMVIGRKVDTVEVAANQAVDLAQQNNAAVQQVSAVVQQVSQAQITADGKASAMWAVKLQVNAQGQYVAAGVGLGIENGPAGLQSSFLVSADTFAVVNGINGTLSSPFAVTGGQVFIRSAFIQDLSLSFGKIADNIQSDNYVANSTGWKLSKSGGMELNSTVAGQGRVQVTNRAVKVWDANGILRVQLGDLAA